MASDYAQIEQDNVRRRGTEFDDIGEFLAEKLYADRSHFVLELLQNAEDALARRFKKNPAANLPRHVTFHLWPNRLEVRHFGELFDEADVRGVCDVLRGTKVDDSNQIGKFGIGFKSVYSMTASPEIHSGDEHFQIQGYIKPRAIAPRSIRPEETLFVFPFNHHRLTATEAHRLIKERLRQLGPRTLLFLHQITEIDWEIEGESRGFYLREERNDGRARRVHVIGDHDGREDDESWLVFARNVATGAGTQSAVEIAYRLNRDETSNTETIQALPRSELAVFFPTAKETHLGFLLHGPFLTTPARDNILEDERNAHLVREAAALVADALTDLKDQRLVTVGLLEALPIQPEAFPKNYVFRPIFDAVRAALRTQAFLPDADGALVSAAQAKLARSAELRNLLGEAQLAELFPHIAQPRWLAGGITQDRTPILRSYLMQELAVDELTAESFCAKIDGSFIERQTDEWLSRLYAFLPSRRDLWRPQGSWERAGPIRAKPFIRLETGEHVSPFAADGAPNAFLPLDGETDFPVVKQSLLEDDAAREFLEQLGLKPPDVVDEVLERVLPRYRTDGGVPPINAIAPDIHRRDLARIAQALEVATSAKKERLRQSLIATPFLQARNAETGAYRFQVPSCVYIPSEELKRYFKGNPEAWFLLPHCLGWPALLAELPVNDSVRVECRPHNALGHVNIRSGWGEHVRGLKGFDPDCWIDGLEHALRHNAPEIAAFVWNSLLVPHSHQIEGDVEHATRQAFDNAERATKRSKLGELVTQIAWLPSRNDARCHKPGDLSFDDLPDGFEHDDRLASVLGMNPLLDQVIRVYGLDRDDFRRYVEHKDEFAEFLRQKMAVEKDRGDGEPLNYAEALGEMFSRPSGAAQQHHVPPQNPVGNPEFRRNRLEEEIREGQELEPAPGERFKRVPGKAWEKKDSQVRTFLQEEYGGNCQVCGETFAKRDGTLYFEGLYLVPHSRARWIDRPGNVLCLCATCCAKFLHGKVESEVWSHQILSFRTEREGGASALQIPIQLCNEPNIVRFTERHAIDLQELLKASDET